MYAYPKTQNGRAKRSKPRVLLLLQGVHHLMLYENMFRHCTTVEWCCLLPARPKDLPAEGLAEVERLFFRHGVRFFSDSQSALAHVTEIDAVVTTWSVPHPKHLVVLPFIALAYEVGLPVFELQHGLFQIGLTYSEDGAFSGSGDGVATALPEARNLVCDSLEWFGDGGIGYPRLDGEERDREDGITRKRSVTFVTNHHWSIIADGERRNCYRIMADAISAVPDADFVLLPHGGEMKSEDFQAMTASLDSAGIANYRIEMRRFDGVYDTLLQHTDLIVASISTTLLDCEMAGTPTVLFRNPSQQSLLDALQSKVTVGTSQELIGTIRDVLYRGYRPYVTTGFLTPFRADVLEDRILTAIDWSARKPRPDILVAAARYLGLLTRT